MISAIIRDSIATLPFGLVVGSNLFAEFSVGEQYVLVKAYDHRPVSGLDSEFRTADIQIISVGFDIATAVKMSEAFAKHVENMLGDYILEGEIYTIKGAYPKTLPIVMSYQNFRAVSINMRVTYSYFAA